MPARRRRRADADMSEARPNVPSVVARPTWRAANVGPLPRLRLACARCVAVYIRVTLPTHRERLCSCHAVDGGSVCLRPTFLGRRAELRLAVGRADPPSSLRHFVRFLDLPAIRQESGPRRAEPRPWPCSHGTIHRRGCAGQARAVGSTNAGLDGGSAAEVRPCTRLLLQDCDSSLQVLTP